MQNCSTVRKRCLIYLSELRRLGIQDTVPLDNAKKLFCRILDLWDRYTVKAYFGTVPTIKRQRIQQRSRYQSGTVSVKSIELTHEVKHTEGYLERMGLVSILRSSEGWVMKVHEAVLVPQLVRMSHVSIENISLSPIDGVNVFEGEKTGVFELDGGSKTTQTNNNLLGERDITGSVKRKDDTLPIEVS